MKSEVIFDASCSSKLEIRSTDVDHVFNNEPAKEAFKCFKTFKVTKNGGAAFLDIFRPEAVIKATVEIIK